MRRVLCVPMLLLCLLTACGGTEKTPDPEALRRPYQEMTGCTMEAQVSCSQEDLLWEAVLRCTYNPTGESQVEVVAPESIAGVQLTLDGETGRMTYGELCLDAGPIGSEKLSPAACLPRLMHALREGWLLEENRESWKDLPCRRLTLDETGENGGKICSTVWLREEDGLPVRGEIETDGVVILTAEFTDFSFCEPVPPSNFKNSTKNLESIQKDRRSANNGTTESSADMGGN